MIQEQLQQEANKYKILVAGDFTIQWTAAAWARGLYEAGATVYHYDWTKDYSPGPLGYLEKRFLAGPGILRINRNLLITTYQVQPDAVLIYAGQPILSCTVRRLAGSFWVAGYHNDDPFGPLGRRSFFRYYRKSLPYYTSHHVFRDINIQEYQRQGCSRVKLLRSFYLPWLHHPVTLTAEEQAGFGSDVVFIGNAEPGWKVNIISYLVKSGFHIRVYSNPKYWHKYLDSSVLRRLPAIHLASGLDYARAIGASKICLALFSQANRDQYSLRSFEIPACGGFMLAQRTPVMEELFYEGSEAEYFSDEKELFAKIHYYLNDDQARRRIALAGRDRCLRDGHDIVRRMRQWLSDLREWGLGENS